MFKKILKVSVLGLLTLGAGWFGQGVPMSDQLPLFEGLRNTAAIIFGVMGAWMAILHPDSLKSIFAEERKRLPEKERATIQLLLTPIVVSTAVIAVVLVLFPLAELGSTIPALADFKELLRGFSFALLAFLTITLLWALLLTLVPGDIIKKHVDRENAEHRVKKRMFGGTNTRSSKSD